MSSVVQTEPSRQMTAAEYLAFEEQSDVRHYVLIAQASQRIDVFTRDDDGGWRFAYASELGDVADLEYIGCKLSLGELSAGIELAPNESNVPPEGEERI